MAGVERAAIFWLFVKPHVARPTCDGCSESKNLSTAPRSRESSSLQLRPPAPRRSRPAHGAANHAAASGDLDVRNCRHRKACIVPRQPGEVLREAPNG